MTVRICIIIQAAGVRVIWVCFNAVTWTLSRATASVRLHLTAVGPEAVTPECVARCLLCPRKRRLDTQRQVVGHCCRSRLAPRTSDSCRQPVACSARFAGSVTQAPFSGSQELERSSEAAYFLGHHAIARQTSTQPLSGCRYHIPALPTVATATARPRTILNLLTGKPAYPAARSRAIVTTLPKLPCAHRRLVGAA